MVFLGNEEIFKVPFINYIVRFFKVIPVNNKNITSIKGALNSAINTLEKGETIALFPEGETSSNLKLRKFHKGFLFIAKKAQVPIQCVALKNTHYVIPYGKYIPRPSFKTIKIIWGNEFHYSDYDNETALLKDIDHHMHQLLN